MLHIQTLHFIKIKLFLRDALCCHSESEVTESTEKCKTEMHGSVILAVNTVL